MEAAHAPLLTYLCDDYFCCDNGAPTVTCRSCGRPWPCLTWQSTHTEAQLESRRRWVLRKHFPDDKDMVEWSLRNPSSYWADMAEPVH